MAKAVNRMMVVPDNAPFFDSVEEQALMKTDDEEAGEVMLVTKQADDKGAVDVLLLFPTETNEGETPSFRPTGIRMTLNAFLNMARMAAVHHQAVVGDAPDEYTSDQAGRILVPGAHGNG